MLNPSMPFAARTPEQHPVVLQAPDGSVQRRVRKIRPDVVVDLQVCFDRPAPGVVAALAGVADHFRDGGGRRGAQADCFVGAARARVGGVRADETGHTAILRYSNEVQQPHQSPAPGTGPHGPPRSLYDPQRPICRATDQKAARPRTHKHLQASYFWPVNGRGRWIGAAAWFAVWWGLATVVFRLFGLVIGDGP